MYTAVMDRKKSEKVDYRVQLTPRLRRDADALFEKRGITRNEGVERVLRWFLGADQIIQQEMLGQLPEDSRAEMADLLARRLAEQDAAKADAAGSAARSRPSGPQGRRRGTG